MKSGSATKTWAASALAITILLVAESATAQDPLARRAVGETVDTVTSMFVDTPVVPLDAANKLWSRIPYQAIVVPREYDHPEPTAVTTDRLPTKVLLVKSMHNGTDIAFVFRWADATKDTTVSDVPRFADAVSYEIPFSGQSNGVIDPLTGNAEDVHMGSVDNPAHLLFWRADLDRVENIVGTGEGGVHISPDSGELPITHSAAHGGATWTVVIKRPLSGSASARGNLVTLARGGTYAIAWSLWNGSRDERNGRKYANGIWDRLVIQ